MNVTVAGYYFFDGYVWQRPVTTTNYLSAWNNIPNNRPSTAITGNIYRTGTVSIGRNASNGVLSLYEQNPTNNRSLIHMNYVSITSPTISPWLGFVANLGAGAFNSMSSVGDQALIFSVDNQSSVFNTTGFLIAPHVSGGGGANFGLKVTEQGRVAINLAKPSESLDIGSGTIRVRNLPAHGSQNTIYTTSTGGNSLLDNASLEDVLNRTQPFNASRTVVVGNNGVFGYVQGLPLTTTSTTAIPSATVGTGNFGTAINTQVSSNEFIPTVLEFSPAADSRITGYRFSINSSNQWVLNWTSNQTNAGATDAVTYNIRWIRNTQ